VKTPRIRVLIVDDEPLAREGIRLHCEGEADIDVVGECADGVAAVQAIRELRPDLVFLDVQMPGLDGFEVLETVGPEQMPAVVFATAYDQFALRAFDAHALDYLLKPFDGERFRKTLDRARHQLHGEAHDGLGARLEALLAGLQERGRYLERVAVRAGGRIIFLRTDEIDWIEAEGNYARLHVSGRAYLLRETMSRLEEKLDPARFVRIHRSTIVRIDQIKELEPLFQGEYQVTLHAGTRLTSSRGYLDKLQELLSG
jgi:two-component system, LytTR family, response regulator